MTVSQILITGKANDSCVRCCWTYCVVKFAKYKMLIKPQLPSLTGNNGMSLLMYRKCVNDTRWWPLLMMLLVNSAMFEINIYCREMFQLFHCTVCRFGYIVQKYMRQSKKISPVETDGRLPLIGDFRCLIIE